MSTARLGENVQTHTVYAADAPSRARPALSLRANFSWMFVGNVVYAGCQFALLVVLARWGSTEIVGRFALATAVATPIMAFSMLHLRALLATDAQGEYRLGEFVALRLVTTVGGWMIVAAVGFVSGYAGGMVWLIAAAGMVSAADALSDLLHGAFQRKERLDCAGIALLCKGPLGLVAVAIAMALDAGLLGTVLALVASRWLVLLAFEFPCAKRMLLEDAEVTPLRPVWHCKRLLRLSWTALPLGLVIFLMSLRSNLPRYLLDHYVGADSLGVFVGILAITQIGGLAVNALGQAASPRLAQFHTTGQRSAFLSLTWKLVLLGGLLGVSGLLAVLLAGRDILVVVFGAGFQNESQLFVVLMAAAAISYAGGPLGYAATASRRIRCQPLLHIINLTMTAAIACYGIRWGTLGVAWAVFVTAALGTTLFAGLLFTKPDSSSEGTQLTATGDVPGNNQWETARREQIGLPVVRHAA